MNGIKGKVMPFEKFEDPISRLSSMEAETLEAAFKQREINESKSTEELYRQVNL